MNAKTAQEQEFIDRISAASPRTVDLVLKFMVLSTLGNGFNEAVKAATPPGEIIPPIDTMQKLVDEWAEKEGL